jgi:hypothetical protein
MIDLDLERALAPFINSAPEPPPPGNVRVVVRKRRRRRVVASVIVVAVVLVGVVSTILATPHHRSPAIATTVRPLTDALNVTAPDGTAFALSGSRDLDLTRLSIRFFAHIRSDALASDFTPQKIVVQDVAAPTPNTCWFGYTYGRWRLILQCGSDAEHSRIHDLLNGRLDANGFVVFDPKAPLKLGSSDAPDVELGDGAIGIFGPGNIPNGCPSAAEATTHTRTGAPVRVDGTGAWWCDDSQRAGIHVGERSFVDDALRSLSVQVGSRNVVTSLYGTTIEIDSPGGALGRPAFDASVQLEGAPFAGPAAVVVVTDGAAPAHRRGAATYVTADGHMLYAAQTGLGQDQLVGTWGRWTVGVVADGVSDRDRARLASLLRFREKAGFLVLDPLTPLHLVPSVGTEIVFAGLGIDSRSYPGGCPTNAETYLGTGEGYPVRRVGDKAIWCDPHARVRIALGSPLPLDGLIKRLRVRRVG